jgi:hypothetical protein
MHRKLTRTNGPPGFISRIWSEEREVRPVDHGVKDWEESVGVIVGGHRELAMAREIATHRIYNQRHNRFV